MFLANFRVLPHLTSDLEVERPKQLKMMDGDAGPKRVLFICLGRIENEDYLLLITVNPYR